MKRTIKQYFIPHADNYYQPHILHTKRTIFYSFSFLLTKGIVVLFAVLLPFQVFTLPDVIAKQQQKLVEYTNKLRLDYGLMPLEKETKLQISSASKAADMAKYQYFQHVGPNGHDLAYFMALADYNYAVAGENLAMGFADPEEIMAAWEASPTHFDNLVYKHFQDVGLAIIAGKYDNKDTIYTVLHLGLKKREEVDKTLIVRKGPGTLESIPISDIAGEKIQGRAGNIAYNVEASEISWQEEDEKIRLIAKAEIAGEVKTAIVYVNEYKIELQPIGGNIYSGELLVSAKADDLFRIVLTPVIKITAPDGTVVEHSIKWQELKVPAGTPLQKYTYAHKNLFDIFPIFSVSRNIYIGFIIFFSLVLLVNILVEIRRQHPHIIAQTLGLIVLLVFLTVV